jgi:trans-aconitate 2-methyltransferase
MPGWNPDAYLKYGDERTQPSYDLAARIAVDDPAHIVDIGCGPGNSTRVLRERWPKADILGLDSSPEMITNAERAYPAERWVLADAARWETEARFDIVFSNAALQWIPQHETLIDRLFALVEPQGALAVQVPANQGSPLYQAIVRVAGREAWREAMAGCDERLVYYSAGFYYDRLAACARRIDLWQTTYLHVMASHQDLIDWYASTGMRPYLERLPSAAQKNAFQREVLEEIRSHYPQQADQKVLFPFSRLFFVAYKA